MASPTPVLADTDSLVAELAPDAWLVTDYATCVVLVTPERRITVTNIRNWKLQLQIAAANAEVENNERTLCERSPT